MGWIGTGPTCVFCRTCGVYLRTESIGGILRTRQVCEAGIERNERIVPNKLVGSNGRATMTAPGKGAAVQQELNR